ncbi:MAG: MFS transporter [Candidatus Eremiobacteraeota bacterium]|nr:MFS transporter [Candidatus Eremiobacteraeota bacterium]
MRSSGFWVLVATILGSSLVFLDGAVVSIALPVMQVELHASSSDAQWIVEGYTLVLGALMLFCGALADRYGRKRIFIIGVVIFAIGSLWCALSPSRPACGRCYRRPLRLAIRFFHQPPDCVGHRDSCAGAPARKPR